jgi:hypothetical protein
VAVFRFAETGVGANFTAYSLPDAIKPCSTGSRPVRGNMLHPLPAQAVCMRSGYKSIFNENHYEKNLPNTNGSFGGKDSR